MDDTQTDGIYQVRDCCDDAEIGRDMVSRRLQEYEIIAQNFPAADR